MASPLSIGTSAVTIAAVNTNRVLIRFQNTGATIIYIKRVPLTGYFTTVSPTDFEVMLAIPAAGTVEFFETNSASAFIAVSSAASGFLAVYETQRS